MIVFIFCCYLAIGLQLLSARRAYLRSQLALSLVLTLVWFNHHASDSLNLVW